MPSAEIRDEGTLQTARARVALLPAPLPIPDYGPLDRVPNRAWTGLRWDWAGLPPGLYTLHITLPVDGIDNAVTTSLPIYLPDPNGLRAARASYLGKRVWPNPSFQFSRFT